MNVIVVAKPLERLEIIYTENGKGKPFGFQFVITKTGDDKCTLQTDLGTILSI